MDKKKLMILASLLLFLVVLVIIYVNLGGTAGPERPQFISSAQDESQSEEPKEPLTIILFFPSEHDSLLHREERDIIPESSLAQQAKIIILELLSGSQQGFLSPIPPETRLRELYITREGVAYVDFSREIMDKHLSGSSAEMSTIYSIVNSLSYNIKPIKKVFILIDGGEKKTLGGHIDLTSPFQPIYDIVAK
ncbi:MAG: GerMN domain-containing protein [Candidatus Aminicenantes bacterium]|nr:MAG: GerMN domain-containing protein [Candidatus Aminicenantes bacterium]